MTTDEIKEITTVPDVLARYGVEVKGGRCKSICHDGKRYTSKVSRDLYFCFKCDESMDVFDIVMHMEGCDFRTAYEMLGGTEKPSFRTHMKARKRRRTIDTDKKKKEQIKDKLRVINLKIDAYRNLLKDAKPLTDNWAYYYNKLQYQLYLHEHYTEMR